jgi:branched-chain amino acid transport system ATP-binding protein
MNAALEISGLTSGYLGVPAVRDITLSVQPGQVLAMLGPNGAGKSTILLSAVGVIAPMKGDVASFGRRLNGMRTEKVARLGVSLVPDNRGVFYSLTVADNLRLARRGSRAGDHEEVLGHFPKLDSLRRRKCGLLSGGEQQMLALAKALLTEPKVLLIDEMSLGLAPIIVQGLLPIIRDFARDRQMAVVLVEQHIDLALRVADQAIVVNHGRVVLEGTAAELRGNRDRVEAAYFGRTDPGTPATASIKEE